MENYMDWMFSADFSICLEKEGWKPSFFCAILNCA